MIQDLAPMHSQRRATLRTCGLRQTWRSSPWMAHGADEAQQPAFQMKAVKQGQARDIYEASNRIASEFGYHWFVEQMRIKRLGTRRLFAPLLFHNSGEHAMRLCPTLYCQRTDDYLEMLGGLPYGPSCASHRTRLSRSE